MKTQQIVTAKIGDQFLFTPNNRIFTVVKITDKSVWTKTPEGITTRDSWNTFNTDNRFEKL